MEAWIPIGAALLAAYALYRLYRRLQLSVAKHRSLTGHAKMSRAVARKLPRVEFADHAVLTCDSAPAQITERRRQALDELSSHFSANTEASRRLECDLNRGISDLNFTNLYRVPYPFARFVASRLPLPVFATEAAGSTVTTLDGEELVDVTGSYGVNVFGHDFYKACLEEGLNRAGTLGVSLGPYHPLIADNVKQLQQLSGHDEVSFHMSGTEAVMQAVRLARYHTGRKRIVTFCGSYHGWWDEVQPGVGNPTGSRFTLMLKDQSEASLRVLRTRKDIACVLVNPIQAMHPNQGAPGDSTLLGKRDRIHFDRAAYGDWLRELRHVCTKRDIALIIDDVFLGFRLAPGGSQEYFNVRADLVTYGKTLGGGLPVGVVCGRASLMKRYRDNKPADVCFARGTFNSHPLVMATMNAFLTRLTQPEQMAWYDSMDDRWQSAADRLNGRLESAQLPVRIAAMTSIWAVRFTAPSRFNWMLQFYLRREGYLLSWTGTGRFVFPINTPDAVLDNFESAFVRAVEAMSADGWFWHPENASPQRALLRETIANLRAKPSLSTPETA